MTNKPKINIANQYKHKWWILFSVSLAILLINIEITAVNLIITPLSKSLHISLTNVHWVISTYLLVFSGLIIASGRIGDIVGHKQTLLTGVLVFIAASLIGGFAQNLWEIIICRILQGLGAAMLWPSTLAIAFNAFPKHQRGIASGGILGTTGLGVAIGPTLGGYFATVLSWRWVFFFNVPIGLLIIIFSWFLIKTNTQKLNETFDFSGLIFLGVAIVSLVFSIDLCNQFLEHIIPILCLWILSFVTLLIFYKTEKNVNFPLIDLNLFKNTLFTFGSLARSILTFILYPFIFIMGLYLQTIYGFTTLKTGILFLPMTLCMGLFSPIGGKLVDYTGTKIPATIGLILYIATLIALTNKVTLANLHFLFIIFSVLGIAYSLTTTAFLTQSMQIISEKQLGTASAIFFMNSIFGGLIGVTVAGVIIGHYNQLFSRQGLIHAMPIMMWIGVGASFLALLLTHLKISK